MTNELPSALSFKVTGLESASRYTYILSVLNKEGTPLHVYVGEFATTGYDGELRFDGNEVIPTPPVIPSYSDIIHTTGVETLQEDELQPAKEDELQPAKVFRNGQIILLRHNKAYTLTGQQLK